MDERRSGAISLIKLRNLSKRERVSAYRKVLAMLEYAQGRYPKFDESYDFFGARERDNGGQKLNRVQIGTVGATAIFVASLRQHQRYRIVYLHAASPFRTLKSTTFSNNSNTCPLGVVYTIWFTSLGDPPLQIHQFNLAKC